MALAILPTTESLGLTGNMGVQRVSTGFLEDLEGSRFSLSNLAPHADLLSPSSFLSFANGATQMCQRTHELFRMPIYRARYEDGTILQVQKDESGEIVNGEIRRGGSEDVLFVKTRECGSGELLVFSPNQIDASANEDLHFEDDDTLDEEGTIETGEAFGGSLSAFHYQNGDGTSSECTYFKVVKVGVVYDADFCSMYGSKSEARNRIMMIVAAASVLFENDMCVKLQLVDIYTPDDDCSGISAFASFRREKACGGSQTFIGDFREWIDENREQIGFDSETTFHAFTGYQPRGTLGCAYIGTVCRNPPYAIGVDYMRRNILSTQSIIFAHELGHNLNARHLSNEITGSFRYLMRSTLQNPHDGFSVQTIHTILGFLDSDEIACDGVSTREPSLLPSELPSLLPTLQPSNSPSANPTMPPSAIPSTPPSMVPSTIPSQTPTRVPSLTPTRLPSWIPSVHDSSAPPSLPDQCSFEQAGNAERCIVASESLFACYEVHRFMNIRPNEFCDRSDPMFGTVSFLSCHESTESNGRTGLSNDEDIHGRGMLRKLSKKSKKEADPNSISNDEEDRTGDSDTIPPPKVVLDVSNDEELDAFASTDCDSIGCAMIDDYVCFNSGLSELQQERAFVVTFSVDHAGSSQNFMVGVTVQRDDTDHFSLSMCDVAATTCME